MPTVVNHTPWVLYLRTTYPTITMQLLAGREWTREAPIVDVQLQKLPLHVRWGGNWRPYNIPKEISVVIDNEILHVYN